MIESLMADISRLQRGIHGEGLPANEMERQATHIFSGTKRILMELIVDDVGLNTLEMGLLCSWLQLVTLNRGYDVRQINRLAGQLDQVMQRLIAELKALAAELDDEGPSSAMAELGQKIHKLIYTSKFDRTHISRHAI